MAGLTLVVGLVAVLLMTGGGPNERATATGDLPPDVIAMIEGLEVTTLDWEIALFSVEYSHQQMQALLADEYFPFREAIEQHQALLDAHSYEVIALGTLLLERATVAAAYAAGFELDEDELEHFMDYQRNTVEQVRAGTLHADPSNLAQMEGTIAVAGEDRYWAEVVPQWGRFTQASEYLLESRGGIRVENWGSEWDAYQHRQARSATVELSPELAEQVDLAEVLDYLEALAAIDVG